MSVRKATMDAFNAVRDRLFGSRLAVMVMKIGIVPIGLIKVKNEVRHRRANASVSDMGRVVRTKVGNDRVRPWSSKLSAPDTKD